MNETYVTVVGNIASDLTFRRVGDDSCRVSFLVISSERRRDQVTGDWHDGDRVVARVTCWRRLAENVNVSLQKGDPVVVWGRLSSDEYEADGVKRSSIVITAKTVGPDLSRRRARLLSGESVSSGDANGLGGAAGLPDSSDAMAVSRVDVSGLQEVSEPPGDAADLVANDDLAALEDELGAPWQAVAS